MKREQLPEMDPQNIVVVTDEDLIANPDAKESAYVKVYKWDPDTSSFQNATFNVEGMAARAGAGNTTTTALADALVRDHGVAFRSAHIESP